jgi:hypothetical protein
MKTHFVKFQEDFFVVKKGFVTYCGLNDKKNPDVIDYLEEDFSKVTCKKCIKAFNKELEETNKQMNADLKAWADEENEHHRKDMEVLDLVKSKLSEEAFDDVKYQLELSENTYNYKITDKPKGHFQKDSDLFIIEGVWVDQTTNGGYTGDTFAGTVSIKLNENEYFEFNYYM